MFLLKLANKLKRDWIFITFCKQKKQYPGLYGPLWHLCFKNPLLTTLDPFTTILLSHFIFGPFSWLVKLFVLWWGRCLFWLFMILIIWIVAAITYLMYNNLNVIKKISEPKIIRTGEINPIFRKFCCLIKAVW